MPDATKPRQIVGWFEVPDNLAEWLDEINDDDYLAAWEATLAALRQQVIGGPGAPPPRGDLEAYFGAIQAEIGALHHAMRIGVKVHPTIDVTVEYGWDGSKQYRALATEVVDA